MTVRSYYPSALAALTILLLAAPPAGAQVPQQAAVFPAGGQVGTTAQVTISGANLQGATGVLVSGQGVTAKITNNSNASSLPVELAIAADAEPGAREVRVVTPRGTSAARAIYLDVYPQINETEPNNTPAQAQVLTKFPVTVNGQVNGAEDVDWFAFDVGAGETWVFDLKGARFKSAIDGYISLRDARGHDLKAAMEVSDRDPRLVYTFPKSGRYFLQVRDTLYRGGPDYAYAVSIGKLPIVVAATPMGVKRGETAEVALEGVNLGDMRTVRVQMPADPDRQTVTVVPMTPAGPANPIQLYAGDFPEASEVEPNDTIAQATRVPGVPVTMNGRIGADRDVDVYAVDAQANQQLVFEVWARRLHSRLDSVLRLLDKDGKEIAQNDDAVGKDSRLSYTPPAAGTFYVEVSSRDNHGSPEHFYRLQIKPPPPSDFSLTVTPDNPNIGPNGSVGLLVTSTRIAYNGEIALRAEGLPAGVTASAALIRAGQNQALMTLTAEGNAAVAHAPIRIIGTATIDNKPVSHPASPVESIQQQGQEQPKQRPVEMNIATVTEQQPYALQIEPRELTIKQGETKEITVRAVRKADFKTAINLAPMNNLLPPGVTAQVKPIPQDQTEVKFNLVAAPTAATVTQNLVFTGNGNNQLQATPALAVTVAPK
jgi:hypothetical protein